MSPENVMYRQICGNLLILQLNNWCWSRAWHVMKTYSQTEKSWINCSGRHSSGAKKTFPGTSNGLGKHLGASCSFNSGACHPRAPYSAVSSPEDAAGGRRRLMDERARGDINYLRAIKPIYFVMLMRKTLLVCSLRS